MLLALALAPQRTTLYGNLARFLAAPEVLASPLAPRLADWERRQLGGQDWLLLDLADASDDDFALLWRLGTVAGVYEYYPAIGEEAGPFLHPLDPPGAPFVPQELIEARRYRGKTSELFTAVLLNLGLFAGAYAGQTGERLRILDPLAGGGTTLFTALVRGHDAVGIEREKEDFDTTDAYVQQFLRGVGIPYRRTEERVRGAGRRSVFMIGRKDDTRMLALVHGNTYDTTDLLENLPGGARFHAIVADLPYGIQHKGQVLRFLDEGVPGWDEVLLPGGTMTFAWEASSPRRETATAHAEAHPGLSVVTTPPYDELEHPVDRQIKRRDVLVLRKEE